MQRPERVPHLQAPLLVDHGPERAPGWAFLIAWLVNLPSLVLLFVVTSIAALSLIGGALFGAMIEGGYLVQALGVVLLLVVSSFLLNRDYGRAVWAMTTFVATHSFHSAVRSRRLR